MVVLNFIHLLLLEQGNDLPKKTVQSKSWTVYSFSHIRLLFYQHRPANLWIPECGKSNFGMRDTKMACIAKHSKQNDKMRDIPDFRTFLLSEWGTVLQNVGHLAGLSTNSGSVFLFFIFGMQYIINCIVLFRKCCCWCCLDQHEKTMGWLKDMRGVGF